MQNSHPSTALGASPRLFDLPPVLQSTVAVRSSEFESWPVITVSPQDAEPAGRLLYLHGGGHITEISSLHWVFVARLVQASGWEAVVPLFPLMPRATHQDIYPTLRRLYEEDIAEAHGATALVGDSSGGTLALALLEMLAEDRRPQHTVLLSPWLDSVLDNPDIPLLEATDRYNNRPHLRRLADLFAGGDDLGVPHVSPLRGDLSGLGHITVFAGTQDMLTPDARVLARTAGPGTQVDLREFPGKTHAWMVLSDRDSAEIARDVAAVLA